MLENILVFVLVSLALVFVGRRIYRAFASDNVDCGCGGGEECSTCSISDEQLAVRCGSRDGEMKSSMLTDDPVP